MCSILGFHIFASDTPELCNVLVFSVPLAKRGSISGAYRVGKGVIKKSIRPDPTVLFCSHWRLTVLEFSRLAGSFRRDFKTSIHCMAMIALPLEWKFNLDHNKSSDGLASLDLKVHRLDQRIFGFLDLILPQL